MFQIDLFLTSGLQVSWLRLCGDRPASAVAPIFRPLFASRVSTGEQLASGMQLGRATKIGSGTVAAMQVRVVVDSGGQISPSNFLVEQPEQPVADQSADVSIGGMTPLWAEAWAAERKVESKAERARGHATAAAKARAHAV